MKEVNKPAVEGLLQDRVAIVTGAAQGIGRGIALAMAAEGASVVIADHDDVASQDVLTQIQQAGGTAFVQHTDVSAAADNQRLVDVVLDRIGRIDILVNNVGIGVHMQSGIRGLTRELAERVIRTNLIEPLFLTKRVVEEMIARQIRGSILFTSSIHARVTYLDPVYTSTKAAIEMLVRDIALDLAETGIRVNAVAPGAIATRGQVDRRYPFVPAGVKGTPDDVAHAMVFLASQRASYITGQVLTIDGGLSLVHEAYLDRKKYINAVNEEMQS